MFNRTHEDTWKTFVNEFHNMWELEKMQDRSFIRKHGYFYECENEVISIYRASKQTLVGILRKGRCWTGEAILMAFLIKLMPEYSAYFKFTWNFFMDKTN